MLSHFLSCTSESPSGVAILALIVSFLSLSWNVMNYLGSRETTRYATLDKVLSELVRDTMLRPDFRNESWITTQLAKVVKDNDFLSYEAHAGMCLNAVETTIKNYGYGIMSTHFGPAMKILLLRHREMYERWKEDLQPLARLYKEMA